MADTQTINSRGARGEGSTAAVLRGMALVIFVLGAVGALAELVLIDHVEDYWQMAPVGLLGASILVLIAHGFAGGAGTIWGFRLLMLLFVAGGVVGVLLHYTAKAEFKKELNPDLAGMKLFWESVRGSSVPPVVAPAMMIQLALVGLAWTHRHPALCASKSKPLSETGDSP